MPETITVPGSGTADAPPDFIQLHLGAIKHGKDPVVILGNVTQATRAMKDEANNQRIKSEDIQTSAFQVHERRVYNPETHEYQQEGFTATQNTSVTIRDLELADMIVGRLIDAMGYAGAAELTLQGVSSGLDDPGSWRSYFPLPESLYHRSERAFAHGVGPASDYNARVNLITKVLDFVQLGGPLRSESPSEEFAIQSRLGRQMGGIF